MKITICGSVAFHKGMLLVRERLEALGHHVQLPAASVLDDKGELIPVQTYYELRKAATDFTGWVWQRKTEAIRRHFDKIVWADAILVTNWNKNGTPHYIGGNTLIEMGLAFFLQKPIYLQFPIPDLPYREEIIGVQPVILDNDLSLIPHD